MSDNSEKEKVKSSLQLLRRSLSQCSVIEGIAAGIIAGQNLNNINRSIGIVNIGRSMIQEMDNTHNDNELIVFSNLITSILNESRDGQTLLPGFKSVNQT